VKKAIRPSLQLTDQPVLAIGNTVITALTGNLYFPAPSPALDVLQTAVDNYSASLAKARYGSREDRAQKNADKLTLIRLLQLESDYVNSVARGDVLKLVSSGFRLSKDPQPVILGRPTPRLRRGASGEFIVSTGAVKGAMAYKYQYTSEPAADNWPEVASSRATCKIENLVPGQIYTVRIVVVGRSGQVSISDTITKMAA
jgi:hypothetical protein